MAASGARPAGGPWFAHSLDGRPEAERAGARARYVEPVEGDGVDATVEAMNRTLASLSRDIAGGIKRAGTRK